MAVAHSASSASHASGSFSVSQSSFSWTHTTSTDPQGVLIFVFQGVAATDAVTSVTYDGVAVPAVSGARAQDTATELGSCAAYYLGVSVPTTNNPTIVVNRTNNTTTMWAVAVTVTAGKDTEVTGTVLLQENGTFAEQSVDDGSVTGTNSVRYAGAYSGNATPVTQGTNSTLLASDDAGAYGWSAVRETTAGQGARSVGFTFATSDDRAAVHLAVREIPPGPTITSFQTSDFTGTTTPKTITVTGGVTGDLIVVQFEGDQGTGSTDVSATSVTTTGGSTSSWTPQNIYITGTSSGWIAAYTATLTASGTVTISLSRTQGGSHEWGGFALLANNHGGVGNVAHSNVSSTETASLTVTQNSTVSIAAVDWDDLAAVALAPAGSTTVAATQTANVTMYVGYAKNQAAGTRGYGVGTSSSTHLTITAVEILASPPDATVTPSTVSAVATVGTPSSVGDGSAHVNAAVVHAVASVGTPNVITKKFVVATAGTAPGYFVDAAGEPILIRGYVLWGLLMNAGRWNGGDWQADLTAAVNGIAAMGVNVLYTESLGNTQNGGNNNLGNTWDGVAPFSSTSPVTFNSTFWQRTDFLFDLCAAAGITIFYSTAYSDDMDTGALHTFTTTQWGQYGTALGNRYGSRPNLVWMIGGDYFDTFNTQITAMKAAIRATGDTHLFSVQNYPETTSRKDIENNSTQNTGTDNAEFNFVYSYNVIYRGIEYANATETSQLPAIWGDGHFDSEPSDRKIMRDLLWWTLTSGGRGNILGSEGTWPWGSGALSALTSETFPNTDLGGIWDYFTGLIGWHLLQPDTDSSFFTAGRGTEGDYVTSSGGGGGEYNTADSQDGYVTGAVASDGSLAICYLPTSHTVTVNPAEMSGAYTVKFVDPISGAETPQSIASTYNPTGTNSLGGADWLIVFEAASSSNATATPAVVHGTAAVGTAGLSNGPSAPAAVAGVAAVPAPTIRLSKTATPAVVSAVAAVPAPTVRLSKTATPSVASGVASVPAPTVQTAGNATASPAVVTGVATVPAPTLTTGEIVSPVVVAGVAAVPAPALHTGEIVSPAVVSGTASVPAPAISAGGSATVSPAVVSGSAGVPASSLHTGETVTATAVSRAVVVPAPTVTLAAVATPTTVAAVAAVPAPAAQGNQAATATPAAVIATTVIPAPQLHTDQKVTATAVSRSVVIAAPTIHLGAAINLSAVVAIATVPQPLVLSSAPVPGSATSAHVRGPRAKAAAGSGATDGAGTEATASATPGHMGVPRASAGG